MKRFLFLFVLFISYGILAQNSAGEPDVAYASRDVKFSDRQGDYKQPNLI